MQLQPANVNGISANISAPLNSGGQAKSLQVLPLVCSKLVLAHHVLAKCPSDAGGATNEPQPNQWASAGNTRL